MIVTRITEEDEEGNVFVSLAMTKEQATYLMNVGLGILLANGAATLKDMTRQQFNEETTQEMEVSVVENVPSPAISTSQTETANENIIA